MEQKFLVYKLADANNRDTMENNINSYLRCGWLVKDIKTIQSDKNIYATVIVLIEKMSNATISIK